MKSKPPSPLREKLITDYLNLQQIKEEWKKEQMLEEEKISKGKEDLSVIETDFVGDQDMQTNEN